MPIIVFPPLLLFLLPIFLLLPHLLLCYFCSESGKPFMGVKEA